jgi:hypothetical protein
MANYYLKNADATRVYRLEYETADGATTVFAAYACATGTSAVLPNKNPIEHPDQSVDTSQVLVDTVLNGLVVATLTEYRTRAKAMIDGEWS